MSHSITQKNIETVTQAPNEVFNNVTHSSTCETGL